MATTQQGVKFWEGAIVPFEIDPNFDNPNLVRQAMRNIYEEQTSLRFVRRSRQESFLRFVNGQACASAVGFQGIPNQQVVCVGGTSDAMVLAHEIGHAVGLKHEHQRSDRDNFVEVFKDNIEPGMAFAFEKLNDTMHLTDYDRRSVMHYDEDSFSKNGMPTLGPVGDPTAILDNSAALTAEDVQALAQLYPHVGIVRRGDSGLEAAGRVREIAVVNGATPARLITAVRTNEGILRLILWEVHGTGGIERIADSGNDAGEATSIAVARGRQVVTAARTNEGNLKVISWNVTNDSVSRDLDEEAGEASLIQLLALSDELFVTACRDADGKLALISWRLESNGKPRRLSKAGTPGVVSDIAFTRVRPSGTGHLVATTVRTSNRMKTTVWRVSSSGAIQERGNSGTDMKDGTQIATGVHVATGLFIVSCRTNEGILRLITLSVSPDGGAINRLSDSRNLAGAISGNSLLPRPAGALSAVRSGDGRIRLIGWGIDSGGVVTRLGDSTLGQAGEVGLVRLAADTGLPNAPIVTCVHTEDRDLRLISWDDDPEHGELAP